jgi:hypothetical protein
VVSPHSTLIEYLNSIKEDDDEEEYEEDSYYFEGIAFPENVEFLGEVTDTEIDILNKFGLLKPNFRYLP